MNLPDDSELRATVLDLLSRASAVPCSTGAQAFASLVPPMSRFQVALGVLLPIIEETGTHDIVRKILAAFILYALYAPHPMEMNPFNSALCNAFTTEKEMASGSEQLTWILWKIVRGEGDDIASQSPQVLSRTPLPSGLTVSMLTLPNESNSSLPSNSYESSNTPKLTSQPSSSSAVRSSGNSSEAAFELVARVTTLLLDARERVLSLTEQKFLTPLLLSWIGTSPSTSYGNHALQPQHPLSLITSHDLPALIAHNPSIAYLVLVALLCSPPTIKPESHQDGSKTGGSTLSVPSSPASAYLSTLAQLPPSNASFDVLGRLLQDVTTVPIPGSSVTEPTTIAELIRTEVLGRFILHSIEWIDAVAAEEERGLISDDRVPRAVQGLCRFYTSLIKLGVVDPALEADSAEIASFTLRYSGFVEANALYRTIALTWS